MSSHLRSKMLRSGSSLKWTSMYNPYKRSNMKRMIKRKVFLAVNFLRKIWRRRCQRSLLIRTKMSMGLRRLWIVWWKRRWLCPRQTTNPSSATFLMPSLIEGASVWKTIWTQSSSLWKGRFMTCLWDIILEYWKMFRLSSSWPGLTFQKRCCYQRSTLRM